MTFVTYFHDFCYLFSWLLLPTFMTFVTYFHDFCYLLSWLLLPTFMTFVTYFHDFCNLLSWLLLPTFMTFVTYFHDFCYLLSWLLLPTFMTFVTYFHDFCYLLSWRLLPTFMTFVTYFHDFCYQLSWLLLPTFTQDQSFVIYKIKKNQQTYSCITLYKKHLVEHLVMSKYWQVVDAKVYTSKRSFNYRLISVLTLIFNVSCLPLTMFEFTGPFHVVSSIFRVIVLCVLSHSWREIIYFGIHSVRH